MLSGFYGLRSVQAQSVKGGDDHEADILRCTKGTGGNYCSASKEKAEVHKAEVMPMFQLWTGALQSDCRIKADGHPSLAGRRETFMKEKENNQTEGVQLPPIWCSSICRNSMNDICVEDCAIKRDCSAFEPRPNLNLSNMPPFPLKESSTMTKEEKFTSVTIYLAKVVDHLQGNE